MTACHERHGTSCAAGGNSVLHSQLQGPQAAVTLPLLSWALAGAASTLHLQSCFVANSQLLTACDRCSCQCFYLWRAASLRPHGRCMRARVSTSAVSASCTILCWNVGHRTTVRKRACRYSSTSPTGTRWWCGRTRSDRASSTLRWTCCRRGRDRSCSSL